MNIIYHVRRLCQLLYHEATLVFVLSSYSKLGSFNWGRWIHLYYENNGFKGNIYIRNGLIDVYVKCGCISSAINVFTATGKRERAFS